jgi:hypothetical protein
MQNTFTRSQRVRHLLTVIGSSVASALLLSTLMVYNYGPTGSYVLRNTLLSPDLVNKLSYNDNNPKTGGTSLFVFDDIRFSFYDPKTKDKKVMQISPDDYTKFYQLVMNDKSSLTPPEDVQASFHRNKFAVLSINVHTESKASWQYATKAFQQVEVLPEGDYYRVELHEANNSDIWAYYYHPDIYQKTLNLFIPSP